MHPESNLVDELHALDLWQTDPLLRARLAERSDPHVERDDDPADLARYGRLIGSAAAHDWAEQANRRAPELQGLDARGRRLERVDTHPHWQRLLASIRASGALARPQLQGDWLRPAVLFYLHGQVEAGSLCPATMTQAALPVLARHAPSLFEALREPLLSTEHDDADRPLQHKRALWLGMGMTEKQGGSDLRSCISTATPTHGHLHGRLLYRIDGHKWFFSAPMSDAHLVLARSDEGPSCFFVPRWRFDASALNGVRLLRLKDKLGNRSNAGAEAEFHGSEGLLVGAPGRGIAVLVEMAGYTRLQCVVGSTALMRAALVQAVHYARGRSAFGQLLVDQPLMQQVLADLALEWEGALALMLRLAESFGRSAADPLERAWQRVITPAAKLWVCKRALQFCGEAMEVLGGNGYVETGVLARLYREAPVNSIWEGSGNVMALDVLRAARQEGEALQAWFDALQARLESPERARLAALRDALAAADAETQARRLAAELALLAQLSLLDGAAREAFCASRLRSGGTAGGLYGSSGIGGARALIDRACPA
ncbi:acyl-CoA dehydrogenase family protein [Pseudorhodoferax sp.]|uniref:acyl-CoA dehydrogenase family protein n=1 Tax=Pseudorhodoferax sp. TaxID=1993553 RepID=UPI001B4A06CE|nr:acyl-CoA dehydrogenase family protein [Pseudorhodoferax sp.]MBP8145769.1 acyl-CoA dehydrogenase family protein [Inhella sp.]